MKSKAITIMALAALAVSACSPPVHREAKAKHAKSQLVEKKIYHFQDGRAGYQATTGEWYYWIPEADDIEVADTRAAGVSRTTQPGTAATGAITSSTASGAVSSAPSSAAAATSARGGFGSSAQTFGATGGQWSRGDAPKADELAEAEVTTETVAESPEGTPETAVEAEATDAAAEAADASESASDSTASESSTESSTDSGSTDSGSSDAGGGGDSGGGGDGGGGGGE